MSLTFSGTITGATVTGLTNPTYTLTVDSAPANPRGKRSVVTAVGGTQPNVNPHTVSSPFYVTYTPPKAVRSLPGVSPVTGLAMSSIPRNEYKFNFGEGAIPLSGLMPEVLFGELRFRIPAGTETNDKDKIRAFISFMGGWFSQNASNIANELIITGVA